METEKKILNPIYGIVVFIIVMAIFVLVFAPLQYRFGMSGLALTELGLLLLTLAAVFLTGQSFKEVFPLARPKFTQILGTLLLWLGCFLTITLGSLIIMYFSPDGLLEVSNSMNAMFSSTPPIITFLIITVMPAICEEALHRGFIQHTFRGISRDWVIVLSMGIIFGIFHLDLYRFLSTALLGMGMSYVMCKTHNFLLPALFHFINNFISFLSGLGSSDTDIADTAALLSDHSSVLFSIGLYLMIGCFIPILFYISSYLLKPSSACLSKSSEKKTIVGVITVLLISAFLLVTGIILVAQNINFLLP